MTKMLIATSSDVAIAYFPKKDHTEGLPFGVVFLFWMNQPLQASIKARKSKMELSSVISCSGCHCTAHTNRF